MILVCPSCDTRYFADETAIGNDGRRVRCASCGHSWFVKPPEEGGAAAPAPAEDVGLTREQVERLRQTAAANAASRSGPHAEFRAREQNRRQRQRSVAAITAWLIGFGVFGASAAGLVVFRDDVVEAWPRSASFYRLAGLEVNRFGLKLLDEDARRSFDGTTPVLTVTGGVLNDGLEVRPAPHIRISLLDEAGAELHVWTDSIGVDVVQPGERVDFTSRIVAPPVETFRLTVTFTDAPLDAPGSANPPEDLTAEGGGAGETALQDAVHNSTEEPEPGSEGYEEPPWNGGDGEIPADDEANLAAGNAGDQDH
jgi:predicted Zn finger-like uncharacterized protein